MDVKQLLARLEALEKFVGFSQAAPDHSDKWGWVPMRDPKLEPVGWVEAGGGWYTDKDGKPLTGPRYSEPAGVTASEAETEALTFSDPAWLWTSFDREFDHPSLNDWNFYDADLEVETAIEVNSQTCYVEVTIDTSSIVDAGASLSSVHITETVDGMLNQLAEQIKETSDPNQYLEYTFSLLKARVLSSDKE